ncbi:hypothetical protein ACFX16_028160 [Malus domestica]
MKREGLGVDWKWYLDPICENSDENRRKNRDRCASTRVGENPFLPSLLRFSPSLLSSFPSSGWSDSPSIFS